MCRLHSVRFFNNKTQTIAFFRDEIHSEENIIRTLVSAAIRQKPICQMEVKR